MAYYQTQLLKATVYYVAFIVTNASSFCFSSDMQEGCATPVRSISDYVISSVTYLVLNGKLRWSNFSCQVRADESQRCAGSD